MVTAQGLATASKAIGALGTGIGAIGSMFGLGSSGGTSLYKSAKLMRYQAELDQQMERRMTKWQNKHGMLMAREGLERAGYNPLLALGASPSTASESVGMSQLPTGSTASFNISQGIDTLLQLAELEKKKAETQNIKYGALGSRLMNWYNALKGKNSNNAENSLQELKSDVKNKAFELLPSLDALGNSDLIKPSNTAKSVPNNISKSNDIKKMVKNVSKDILINSPMSKASLYGLFGYGIYKNLKNAYKRSKK
jgi:hypothetical protein